MIHTLSFKTPERTRFILLLFMMVCIAPCNVNALESNEVLVIANKNSTHSAALAHFYMQKRSIPRDNLLILQTTTKETCSRNEYVKNIAEPVSRHLKERATTNRRIRCLVLMFGMPLKIASPHELFRNRLNKLKEMEKNLSAQKKKTDSGDHGEAKELRSSLKQIKDKRIELQKNTTRASLDSELALVLEKDYPLKGWLPNPYYLGFQNQKFSIRKDNVLMVSRLDGPSEKTVKRIINDSIQAEKKGLFGTAYFDARWPAPDKKKLSGYALYDYSIHRAADWIQKRKLLPVVVDDNSQLFQPGKCPDAALYCGWYSLANYVDAFTWQMGAVGYHIASSECLTLRESDRPLWCKMMLEKGAAATIGPVGEPYVQAFPLPELFFRFLVDGYLTLAECYLISTPYLSWKMVLIGDPLYRPYHIHRAIEPQSSNN